MEMSCPESQRPITTIFATREIPEGTGRRRRALSTCLRLGGLLAMTATSCNSRAQAAIQPSADYQTAASILSLSPEQANRHAPVRLRGVVLRSTYKGVTLADHTAGIWVYFDHPFKEFSAGDEIEVIGVTDPGMYSPSVDANSVRKLGRAPLPRPAKVNYRQLSTGNYVAQYITLTGIVRSVGILSHAEPSESFWMRVEMADGTIDVAFPEDCSQPASKLIDALVQFTGTGSSAKNQNMQMTAPTLIMSGMEGVTVLRPPPPDLFALPITPIAKLMQFRSGTDYFHRVLVSGTVTYYKPGEGLILEDQNRALFAETAQSDKISIGDHVEAVGFPAPSGAGPILRDSIFRDIAPGQQLLPAAVTPADLSTGKFNYNLVSTEGLLLRRVREPSREVFLLQVQSSLLLAELSEAEQSTGLQNLQEGSMIRISGISVLDVTGKWNAFGASASSLRYRILLRSPNDIHVIQPPSWWTTTHVVYLAGFLAILTLIFLVMAVLGRVEEWRLQAVLAERERLAHEVHDTLAQSFAGIGFQLQAIRKAIPADQADLRDQIDLAKALVRHSHKEARRSIEPMPAETLEQVDLLSSLETSARTLVEGGSVHVSAEMTGTPRPLPDKISVSLLRIGQEAIANAIRHADPGHLKISIAHEQDSVRLKVEDDGCGFVKSGDLLGFGLRGMRKRAAAILAKLEIVSVPGQGTTVEIIAPLPPRLTLALFFHNMRLYVWERMFHVDSRAK